MKSANSRKQGKLILFSAPKITHIGGETSGDYYSTEETENGKNLWNKKGRQIIVSNMLRIRKQFGKGWYLLIISVYFFEIPLFAICLLIEKIIHPGKARYSWQNVKDYIGNMTILLKYFFRILQNKKYFYKVA